ncbi:MAG: hypothetical protein N2259_02555 [Patescibacteria group bacterium]|nr:hypothetical protein [Patescibacteria group bacterium]
MEMWPSIGENKKFLLTGLSILFLIILFFNISFWQSILIGLLFSISYFLVSGLWLGKILGKILNLDTEWRFLFGLFLLLYLIAFSLALPAVFYKITPVYFYVFLLLLTLTISFVNHFLNRKTKIQNDKLQIPKNGQDSQCFFKNLKLKIKNFIPYLLYSIFYIPAFLLLIKARTGQYLDSPWQVISPLYLIFFSFIFFLTVLFIFSQKKPFTILIFIILASFLLHAYLPIVHENNFGVDRWRQLGAERRLMAGQIEAPALFGGVIKYKKIGPLQIPEVFFAANKFSYASNWGLTIGLSWLTGIDIFYLDLFLILILWSVFLPIFTFQLVNLIFKNEKIALLSSLAVLLPFPFQTDGAITLPKTVSFLFFVFALIVIFQYLKGQKKLLPLIIFFFLILSFHYILFLILSLEIFIFGLVLKTQPKKICLKKIFLFLFFIIFSLSLIFLDRISETSFFQYKLSEIPQVFPSKVKDFLKKILLGQYFYYFEQGQPLFPLKPNFFFVLFVWSLVIVGLIKSWKKDRWIKILAIFLLILIINQFLSLSLMKNYRLLARRSSMITIFLLVIFFSVGLIELIEIKLIEKVNFKPKLITILLSVFLTIFASTTYASGPYNLGTVTRSELGVARFLWQEIKKEPKKRFCIFDSSWRLLALEAESGIIAGNFPFHPIDFVQKEKDELYRQMLKNPSREILNQTLEITGAEKCFLVVNQEWLKSEIFDKIKKFLGEPRMIDNVYFWYYEK